ncbi:E3 ubiquitin-protein ligase UPL3 [Phytophthora citrophthora]|uniref:E3 ubiquitin-protein ligase UPL3 n=1 Tax=Phytophthora citrophthora TaxID=4793 RepID=A0AAD9LDJ3_9STRA|nr:E3 ubiquitin-protein ligase UPL3 [Phytophthora citrophthora]
MEQPSASTRGRKRRGGKRKRSTSHHSEDEERKSGEPQPKSQQEEEKKDGKESETPKQWNCPACTFLNGASRSFCEMCTTANPSPPPSAARALGGDSEWSCPACTVVNAGPMRVCAVCGTLNPRPAGLGISRFSNMLGDESLSSSSEDNEEEDSDSDDEDDEEDTWLCRACDTLSIGHVCSNCFAQRPKIARKTAADEKKSKDEVKEALLKQRKRRKREKKLQGRSKVAYGVSIYELKKLILEPKSSHLVDTLQTLTHTLAMMDASADNEWADGPSFLIRGFGAGRASETAKDPELLAVLVDMFSERERIYPAEIRLLALQSVNYLMKMDRHMFARAKLAEVVGLYITELLAWKSKSSSDTQICSDKKNSQMIVEECLNGLSSMCSTEAIALRDLVARGNFVGYLDFVQGLIDGDGEQDDVFHPSILMTAISILQKCCMKLRWSGKFRQKYRSMDGRVPNFSRAISPGGAPQDAQLTLELTAKLIGSLRCVLEHKHVPLHVKAAKCLLLIFHRTPHDVVGKLITPEIMRKFVAVVVNSSGEESEESRLAMVTLLLHLFDNRLQLVNLFIREKIYGELFGGMLQLLRSSSTSLRTNVLKLTAMLSRMVCRNHLLGSLDTSRSPQSQRNRQRLDSLPDPDVLPTLLLDFIRADSIAAVNVLLKDGADLNFPKMFDVHENEIDKPLNVAVECASLAMVRLLLKRGADIHQVGIGGTALHVAARTGRCDVAAFLLQCGARVQARDREKKTVMDVISAVEKNPVDESVSVVPSPMQKLLELYQAPTGTRHFDMDLSENEEVAGSRNRGWFYPSDDEYGDDDDGMDGDELDGEEGYYMDYDEEEEDDEEGFCGAGRRDEEMGDEEIPSDEDMVYYSGDRHKTRLRSVSSESEMKAEEAGRDTRLIGDSSSNSEKRMRSSSECDKIDDEAVLEVDETFNATADEVYDFSLTVAQCLLAVLRDMDIQNVERSVISSVACVLEMAPSQLIHTLKEADVMLILDTVHFLLQGEKHHHAGSDAATSVALAPISAPTGSQSGGSAAQNTNLPSFILAVRILQAMVRKSPKESSLFHQIERRGISEQIELLNDTSACWVSKSHEGAYPRTPSDTIFGRGLHLLKSLRADMLESGMLHLHKLRNLARRLKDFSEASNSCESELVLVDLVDLFEQPNSITTYEFKQSELLPAVLQYLLPQGELDEARAMMLMRAFERYPSALKHLVFRLQSIITQEESFPLVSFATGKGRELYPLTRQLKIAFMRPGDRSAGDKQHGGLSSRPKGKSIHASPLTHFQSFERTVSRCMPVIDSDLSLVYLNMVGHSIQKVVEGKWRKYLVVGYDDVRSYHLLKPIGGTDEDLTEMVLHDSQCKLIGNVDVYERVTVDLTLFGSSDSVDSSSHSDGKKKRKNNKRKRKSSAQKLQQLDNEGAFQVEVKNAGGLKMARLPGAWYAAVLVNDLGEVLKSSDGSLQTCEDVLASQNTQSVKLLSENRIVRKVPTHYLRSRTLQPQVGSVVEVDGSLGEVTRAYSSDHSSSSSANELLDVRISSDIEKARVKKDRVRFPPYRAITPKIGDDDGQIEAMSMRRLFPARDSSLMAGSVGDRVWVLPPTGSSIKDLCIAGTIKSFPSGLESIREASTVLVDISFGSAQPSVCVKAKQNRILNFATDGGMLSGRAPSRLLAALQMASGRSGSSRLFGGRLSGQDSNSSAFHRAFERAAGSFQQNRLGGGLGSSGRAMDQLRNLISRGGHNAPSDVDVTGQAQTSSHSTEANSLANELIGCEVEEASASVSSTCTKATGQLGSSSRSLSEETSSTLQENIKHEDAKPKMTCSQLPKVNLVVGFRKCDVSTTSQDRIVVSSEFGLERIDKRKANKTAHVASHLIQLNVSTQRFEAKAGARKALLDVFNSFNGSSLSGVSQSKKRKKLSPVAQDAAASVGPWDIEKFIAFMVAVRGPTKYGHSGSNAKYCVIFSKFADPDTSRRLLKLDEFVSLMVNECKDEGKSKQLLKFLRSRGYSEKSLTSGVSRTSSGDDEEEKDSPTNVHAKMPGHKTLRQPVVLRGFAPDQNVLKCVEDLRQEYRSRTSSSSDFSEEAALPPWKLTYKLYCDFQVEWEAEPSSKPTASDSLDAGTAVLEPLAVLESKPPARLLLRGVVALDGSNANGASEASRWLSRISTSQTGGFSRGKLDIPDSVASAVRLLHYLFQFRTDVRSLDEGLWTSPRLYNKLETQMQDVLSMCSGIYPSWCDSLITHCKFFFPRELREKLFRSTSFGCTRSLHWFRNQLNIEESSTDSMSAMIGGGVYNQEITISPIPKERVKVHRENILQSAEAVMKMHAKRKAILDVVFVGEKGYGSGVTAAFYSTTAHALQVVTENQKHRYWIPGEDDEAESGLDEVRHVDGVDVVDAIADDAAVIRHPNNLFPYPHRKPSPKLIDRFRMMGRLAGKALMDERLLPLPLSPQFMKLVIGESFGLEELGDIFLSHGRILYSMYKASNKLSAGEENVQIDQTDVQDWLDAVGFTFIDPFSQKPLVAGGEDVAVTTNNLILYVGAVLELWLDSGIRSQVLAFREGISEVLPLGKLRLLFVPELLALLCGEDDIKWTVESLMKDTKLAHGYTKDSQPVQFFFEVLEEMSATERRAFLLYATGCPNLPPGGFQALKPPFEVVRRVVDNLDVDRALPFARTCTNTLHLPAYSSKDVLAKQMAFAIANSRGVIDRD